MKEDRDHNIPFDLISRYLSGNASDSEVNRLEEWVASSADHKTQFQTYKKTWILSGVSGNHQGLDVEKEWKTASGQLFSGAKVVSLPQRSKSRRFTLLRTAAAVVLLIGALFWFFRPSDSGASLEVIAQNEVKEQNLPDGSRIALNQYSTLSYSSDSKEAERRVELSGDAFFEVKKDPARPFVIRTQEVEVAVLGTSFYVDSREDQSTIRVIVRTGKVAMTAGKQRIELNPEETGVYDKSSGQLKKEQNEDANYLAWKTDILVFDNTDLEKVILALNRKFHSQISLAHPGLRTCKLTATFENKSLEAIVRIIERTLNLSSEKSGEKIVFSGEGCN